MRTSFRTLSRKLLQAVCGSTTEPMARRGTRVERLEQRALFALLGVAPDVPITFYNSTGVTTYDSAAQDFTITATPLQFALDNSSPLVPVTGSATLAMKFKVSNAGSLAGGVSGDDFVFTGDVDVDDNGSVDYSGTLLTGEISAFGYQDQGTTDQYDMRFTVTGGLLSGSFVGKDIAVNVTSENSVAFTGAFNINFNGGAKGVFGAIPSAPKAGNVSGLVYCDDDLNGVYGSASDGLLAGAIVRLTNADNSIVRTFTTGADGKYTFIDLPAGTYSVAVTTPAPNHFAELSHGSVIIPSQPIQTVVVADQTTAGPNFPELLTGGLSGFVWEDTNCDGMIDNAEVGINNVTVKLTGTDIYGNAVTRTDITDSDGAYSFEDLMPGVYKLVEYNPLSTSFTDGADSTGSLGGSSNCPTSTCYVGYKGTRCNDGRYSSYYGGYKSSCFTGYASNCYNNSTNNCQTTSSGGGTDAFCAIPIGGCGDFGVNYNFGEKGKALSCNSSTASTIFWNGCKGQALLASLNGGPNKTNLSNWMATTFPNLFGTGAQYNLAGMTNVQIAGFFNANACKAAGVKLNAELMAAAFNAYVTDKDLAGGTYATKYGFKVEGYGVGYQTVNIGANGAAFGLPNNSNVAILQALQLVDDRVVNGVLYGGNSSLKQMAFNVFNKINTIGGVS